MEKQEVSDPVYHIPALLKEAVNLIVTNPDGVYIDATFGGGGHSRGILKALSEKGKLFSFDRDKEAQINSPRDSRFTFVLSNFRYIENFIRYYGLDKVDGILADLGVSFHHFDTAERGFSFRADAPLDMRMNRLADHTAADILEEYNEKDLLRLMKTYTDLKRPAEIVKKIIERRKSGRIKTTFELAETVSPALDARQEKKELAQVFQALRIEVNHELEDLSKLLEASAHCLKPGGRLGIITYHSGEDRLVKNFFKSGNIEGNIEKDFFGNVETGWKSITRKPIEPDEKEIESNPRSRSARLRVAEKI